MKNACAVNCACLDLSCFRVSSYYEETGINRRNRHTAALLAQHDDLAEILQQTPTGKVITSMIPCEMQSVIPCGNAESPGRAAIFMQVTSSVLFRRHLGPILNASAQARPVLASPTMRQLRAETLSRRGACWEGMALCVPTQIHVPLRGACCGVVEGFCHFRIACGTESSTAAISTPSSYGETPGSGTIPPELALPRPQASKSSWRAEASSTKQMSSGHQCCAAHAACQWRASLCQVPLSSDPSLLRSGIILDCPLLRIPLLICAGFAFPGRPAPRAYSLRCCQAMGCRRKVWQRDVNAACAIGILFIRQASLVADHD